ncbi:MAG: shikimate kinase [Candidatus Eremiobacteraeota bacterium]|nr:shikimate kinase [Candidatus Eremiobacteraeota bacterium]MBV8280676.1 shikimate kinase [Candidatus Eremiobacteraeota bacterium]
MHIALTGFMGAGKSTVGRRLARLLELPFADCDAEIVKAHGPIRDIFASAGESAFRDLERQMLARLISAAPSVIAVGGGAVLDPANRRLLRARGCIVHLAISAEAAHARVVRRTHRPLLGEAPTLERVRELLAARAIAYADNDLSILVDGDSSSKIAAAIARWYRGRIGARARR